MARKIESVLDDQSGVVERRTDITAAERCVPGKI
jgi:hypothetical protein